MPEQTSKFDPIPPSLDEKKRQLQRAIQLCGNRLEDYIRHHLHSELRSTMEPHDVLQDVYFEAFRRIGEFEERADESTFAWLATIARRRLVSHLRAKRTTKRGGRLTRYAVELSEVESLIEELALYTRTPSQSAISHEAASRVQKLLSDLHPLHRTAIQLRYIDGLSGERSAEKMGRSQAAVFMLCRRGLKHLRLKLIESGELSAT